MKTADSQTPPVAMPGFLSGGGELSERIAAHDWSATPLGPLATWPQSLKTTVSLMLNSRHPMWVGWGGTATFLYNDAYISVLSHSKHPWALGRPAAEVWAEIWDVCGPLADRVFHDGQASFQDDVRLFMRRAGYVEEVFYSFSYSPIRDETGGVGGLFCPSAETTSKVLGARRLATLSELAAKALVRSTAHEACQTAMSIVGGNADDVPFALLFLPGRHGELHLESSARLGEARRHAADPGLWHADQVYRDRVGRTVPVPRLAGLPIGLAEQPVRQARVVPVSTSSDEEPIGVLVAAVSPARMLDREYESFFALLASQLANTIQNARAAEETRKRAEKLAELDRAKTVFFSNVSHELRTPLTLMLSPLEELRQHAARGEDPVLSHTVDLALRNGQRLRKLVNTLLDFSRIEAGRMHARYVPSDVGALTADLASNFRSAVEKAGMRLAIQCSPVSQPVYLDREMWEKIVLNLLSNAFKYTLEGEIGVRVEGDDKGIVLSVTDTGTGIPAHELPRLFERFHRVEGARGRTHEGTGIGLALVHELVRLHGGSVRVRSEVGQGSCFEVRIPYGSGHLPPERVSDAPQECPRAVGDAYLQETIGWLPGESPAQEVIPGRAQGEESGHILLAEDNADMRGYIARLLEAQGYHVVLASDGAEALELARATPPELVITDVMMPRLDGFGLLAALRQLGACASTPVLMLSARAGEEARVEGLQAGADDYLVKPFSARELLARVGGMLAVARVRRHALEVERRLRTETEDILESIREGFIALDGEWRFTYVNAEAERINGVSRAELIGRRHWDVYPEALGTELEARYRQVMEQRVPVHFENFYAPWNRWFELSCYPVDSGGISIYYRDITERKRVERIAMEAERRKDEFIATLAHELRNPLAPIRSALQVLQHAPNPAAAARMRQIMERQVNHMVRLIDDLLDVARISRGKLELRRQRVALSEAIHTAIETSRPLIQAGRHQLSVGLPPGEVWLDADPTRLAQILANLLNNAAKYTPEGGAIRIEAALWDAKHVRVTVRDTGSGIPADLLPHVFEMFKQGQDTLSRAQGGLGIGLTLVQQLVQLHGGEVSASSDGPGQGSTFTVTLPVPQADDAVPRDEEPVRSGKASNGLEVLVADDNADAATTLCALLDLMGHRCVAVDSGSAAIEAFQRGSFDVVMLDIGMPGMNGYEAARRLREMQASTPRRSRIMALTGWAAETDRARSAEAGFDLHLTKPVEAEALRMALESAVPARFATEPPGPGPSTGHAAQ